MCDFRAHAPAAGTLPAYDPAVAELSISRVISPDTVIVALGGVTVDEMRIHMGERLVSYKCPDTYEFVDEPVRDDAGKVRRSMLSAERS